LKQTVIPSAKLGPPIPSNTIVPGHGMSLPDIIRRGINRIVRYVVPSYTFELELARGIASEVVETRLTRKQPCIGSDTDERP